MLVRLTNDQLVSTGTLVAQYGPTGKIELLDIGTGGHTEYIPRHQLQPPPSPEQKQSPRMSKPMTKRQKLSATPSVAIPDSMVTDDGVPVAVMSFLEVGCLRTFQAGNES